MRALLFTMLLAAAMLLLSCSSNDSTPTKPASGGTASSIAIGGTLQASGASLVGGLAKVSGTTAIEGYKIIAQALSTKRIYVVSTDAEGVFSFTVSGEDSYTFHILNDHYFYVGPLILDTFNINAAEIPGGMETDTSDVDLGDVILSEDEFVAVLADGDVVTIDEDMLVDAIGGFPAGAATQGEGVSSGSGNALDLDGDGVINIMDSDDDGDGILDEFDSDHVPEAVCTVVGNIALFSNFHNEVDESGNLRTSLTDHQYIITVESIVRDAYRDHITSVRVYGPDYLDSLVIVPEGEMYDDCDYWMDFNDRCLLENYFLQASGERWGAFLLGSGQAHIWEVVQPGDVWVFELTYNLNGTSYTELMAKKINFVFAETPGDVTINGATWTSAPMYDLPDTIVVRWSTLSDLPGMMYQFTYFLWVDGQQYDAESRTLDVGIEADSIVFPLSDTTLTGNTIDYYYINVVASDAHGDNAKTMGGSLSKWSAE